VSEHLCRVRRGVRGGCRGAEPPARGFGGSAPENFFLGRHIFAGFEPTYFRDHMILGGFRHMVFADGFLFPVKELGFWTNPGHWVRVLDAAGSYMYIVL
jgi:hypothetical protein